MTAFATAVTIARYEAVEEAKKRGEEFNSEFTVELNESHLRKALGNLAEFEEHQFRISKMSPELIAANQEKRPNSFTEES